MKKLGLIAGDKNLPFEITKWAKNNNVELFVAGIKECVNPKLKTFINKANYIEPHLSQLSKVIKFFKKKKRHTPQDVPFRKKPASVIHSVSIRIRVPLTLSALYQYPVYISIEARC